MVDPDNEYPSEFSGHIRATLEDGSVMEVRKSHMRGGAQEPLSDDEIGAKFQDNAKYGGWSDDQMNATAVALENIAALGKVDLSCTRG